MRITFAIYKFRILRRFLPSFLPSIVRAASAITAREDEIRNHFRMLNRPKMRTNTNNELNTIEATDNQLTFQMFRFAFFVNNNGI